MTAAAAVDPVAQEFVDILCSDSEWVDEEFEHIVAGLQGAPPTAPSASRPSGDGPRALHVRDEGRASADIDRAHPRLSTRSPPGAATRLGRGAT